MVTTAITLPAPDTASISRQTAAVSTLDAVKESKQQAGRRTFHERLCKLRQLQKRRKAEYMYTNHVAWRVLYPDLCALR